MQICNEIPWFSRKKWNSVIFPYLEFYFAFFQVFHDICSPWAPCIRPRQWSKLTPWKGLEWLFTFVVSVIYPLYGKCPDPHVSRKCHRFGFCDSVISYICKYILYFLCDIQKWVSVQITIHLTFTVVTLRLGHESWLQWIPSENNRKESDLPPITPFINPVLSIVYCLIRPGL